MHISRSFTRVFLLSLCGITLAATLPACQTQTGLFADPDASTSSRLRKYYGNDSAVETTEARKKQSDMGFGLPLGGGGGGGGSGY